MDKIECECGNDFDSAEEYNAHLKSDYKDHPILFDKSFSEGLKQAPRKKV